MIWTFSGNYDSTREKKHEKSIAIKWMIVYACIYRRKTHAIFFVNY